MKRFFLSLGGATVVALALAATALAGGPMGGNRPTDAGTIGPSVLGLSQAQIQELRRDGLSLAEIADRQKVDAKVLVERLVARWTERITVRVQNGALTEAQATTLRNELQTRATDMVNRESLGGMQGAAVGAGPHRGSGTCDGSGPNGHAGS